MTTLLGIYREPTCSPGRHRANDAAILELVATELEARGFGVVLATMSEAERVKGDSSLVFSMCRSPEGLDTLERWKREGTTVVNRPGAVLGTSRHRLAERIFRGPVRVPETRVVPTARARRSQVQLGTPPDAYWIKGGDLYASTREDVQRVQTMQALDAVLDDFERRAISTAVLQAHVPGREIKFYAVGSGEFFHWLDVGDALPDREAPERLQHAAAGAGTDLELEIFGGDVVIGADGRITLIDLNDWPSFAPCRDEGAIAIARYLEARLSGSYAGSSLAVSAVAASSPD
jgi:hypothetical protein